MYFILKFSVGDFFLYSQKTGQKCPKTLETTKNAKNVPKNMRLKYICSLESIMSIIQNKKSCERIEI